MSETQLEKGKRYWAKIGNVVLYVISIFIFMGAMTEFEYSVLSAIVIGLSALFLFPPTRLVLKKIGAPRVLQRALVMVPLGFVVALTGIMISANSPEVVEQKEAAAIARQEAKIAKQKADEASKPKTYSWAVDGSEAQRFLINLISETKSKFSKSDTSGKKKFYWIEASKKLCASEVFNVDGLQRGWLGQLDTFNMRDDGGMSVEFDIDGYGNSVRQSFGVGEAEELGLQAVLLNMKEGQLVHFSGQFVRGKAAENECLRAGLDSNPELERETFDFKFARIELL